MVALSQGKPRGPPFQLFFLHRSGFEWTPSEGTVSSVAVVDIAVRGNKLKAKGKKDSKTYIYISRTYTFDKYTVSLYFGIEYSLTQARYLFHNDSRLG